MRPADPNHPGFVNDGMGKSFTFEPPDGPLSKWRVVGSYELADDGRATIKKLEISPREAPTPRNGITGTLLREISPASLATMVRSKEEGWLSFLEEIRGKDDDETLPRAYLRVRDSQIEQAERVVGAPRSEPNRPRGRPPLSDDFLTGVVLEHLEEIETNGGPYGAIKFLAENRGVPYNTAKDWTVKARARGFYPSSDDKE